MSRNQTLRQARMLRGWSQGTVALKIETSTKNISRWERGETVPSPYYRERLCQLFNADAQSLGLLTVDEQAFFVKEELSSPSPSPQLLIDLSVPPLLIDPALFIGREPLLQDLLQKIQPGSVNSLYGLPGSGKTTLLQIIARHPQIRERFFDGVLWVGLGLAPDIPQNMSRLAQLLNVSPTKFRQEHTEEQWLQLLREALAERHLLLILDDAWTTKAVLPFLIGGPFVSYAITTRQPKVAFELAKGKPLMLPTLSPEASTHLLTELVAPLKQTDRVLLQKIVELTGGLPLAIMLIGRFLASHSYEGQIRRLETALNQIADRGYRLNLSASVPAIQYQYTPSSNTTSSLSAVIALSDQQLVPVAREALRALSVLPTAPACFSEDAALAVIRVDVEVLDLLVDAGLIQPAVNHCYRIHRTIADYARHHLKGKEAFVHLVHYMHKVAVNHTTNFTLLEREYATLLIGLDTAVMLQMHRETIEGVLALLPFMRMYGFYIQADNYLRKALHAAISQQDLPLCQRILGELANFAQLRKDDIQFASYRRIQQTVAQQPTDQYYTHILLQQISTAIKEHVETPRHYVI